MYARTDLPVINGMHLTLNLSNSIVAISRGNMHKGVLFNFNHSELSPSNPGLSLKSKSHKTGCEQIGG